MTTTPTAAPRHYMTGFANEWATEAIAGALPVGRNSPQVAPLGLYAEQLSGTAFTAPRHSNRRSWLYRIRPGAMHLPFEAMALPAWKSVGPGGDGFIEGVDKILEHKTAPASRLKAGL